MQALYNARTLFKWYHKAMALVYQSIFHGQLITAVPTQRNILPPTPVIFVSFCQGLRATFTENIRQNICNSSTLAVSSRSFSRRVGRTLRPSPCMHDLVSQPRTWFLLPCIPLICHSPAGGGACVGTFWRTEDWLLENDFQRLVAWLHNYIAPSKDILIKFLTRLSYGK